MAHRLIKANYKKFYNDLNYGQPAVVAIWLDKNDYDHTENYLPGRLQRIQ